MKDFSVRSNLAFTSRKVINYFRAGFFLKKSLKRGVKSTLIYTLVILITCKFSKYSPGDFYAKLK